MGNPGHHRRRCVGALLCAAVSTIARPAVACPPGLTCLDADLSPTGDAPANVPALAFWPQRDVHQPPSTTLPTLFRIDGARHDAVAFTTRTNAFDEALLVPSSPFVEGAQYEVTGASTCTGPVVGAPLRFTATAPATLPTALGVIDVGAISRGPISIVGVAFESGTCGPTFAAAWVDARVSLSAEALPWVDALRWSATLDGAPWRMPPASPETPRPGTNGLGFGVERFFVQCGAPDAGAYDGGPRPGVHRLGFVAHVPGHDVALTVETTVDLRCDEASDAGAVADVTVADVPATDATFADATADAHVDATTMAADAAATIPMGAGCSVGVPERARRTAIAGAWLLVLTALRRRRRRG